MGNNQRQNCQVWLKIQSSQNILYSDLFDLNKKRNTISKSKLCFPSFLHYNQQSKNINYSLVQDRQNTIGVLNYSYNGEKEIIISKRLKNLKNKIWKLLNDSEQVEIKKGDFIRLGRVQLEIVQLKFLTSKTSLRSLAENKQNTEQLNVPTLTSSNFLQSSDLISRYALSRMKQSMHSDFNMKKSIYTEQSSGEPNCRICFDGSSSITNPLFNVCQCSGSVKNIHYQCIKKWIKNKMGRVQTSHCIYYHYQPLICDLCRKNLEKQIKFNNQIYSLVEPQKMHPPYARLRHIQDNKIFQILIRLEEHVKINIGRNQQNQLYLNDSSVSKSHCLLYYSSQRLFIKGKKSKYGTFIELSKSMELESNKPIQLLIQNNIMTIQKKSQRDSLFNYQCCQSELPYHLVVK